MNELYIVFWLDNSTLVIVTFVLKFVSRYSGIKIHAKNIFILQHHRFMSNYV